MDRRSANRVENGLLVIGLGVIWAADWWWPGIMIVLGVAWGSGFALRRRYWPAAAVVSLFIGLPVASMAGTRWNMSAPLTLIGLGAIVVARGLYLKHPEGLSA